MSKPKKIRRRRKKSKRYFTEVHEQAIIDYASSQELRERTKLYKVYIRPVFHEMVDKIVYTYKFNTLPNVDSLKEECKIWLVTILEKFDPEKGHKAFSYFSVIPIFERLSDVSRTGHDILSGGCRKCSGIFPGNAVSLDLCGP